MVLNNNTEGLNVPITDVDGRLYSPSANRNCSVILELITKFIPNSGKALEIASGTGQHIIELGSKFKDITWQPSDLDEERIKSINNRLTDNSIKNIKIPCHLNATREGWSKTYPDQNFILIINLLHLISLKDTKVLLSESFFALAPKGFLIIYGPFMRDGKLTSKGDIDFNKSIKKRNNKLGYKNDINLLKLFLNIGFLHEQTVKMPANNLAFIIKKPI
jgi:hypothetical protein